MAKAELFWSPLWLLCEDVLEGGRYGHIVTQVFRVVPWTRGCWWRWREVMDLKDTHTHGTRPGGGWSGLGAERWGGGWFHLFILEIMRMTTPSLWFRDDEEDDFISLVCAAVEMGEIWNTWWGLGTPKIDRAGGNGQAFHDECVEFDSLGDINLGDSLTASLLLSVFNSYCVVLAPLCLRIDSAQTPVIIPCVVKVISWLFPL